MAFDSNSMILSQLTTEGFEAFVDGFEGLCSIVGNAVFPFDETELAACLLAYQNRLIDEDRDRREAAQKNSRQKVKSEAEAKSQISAAKRFRATGAASANIGDTPSTASTSRGSATGNFPGTPNSAAIANSDTVTPTATQELSSSGVPPLFPTGSAGAVETPLKDKTPASVLDFLR